MPVSDGFRDFVLEQLGQATPVTAKRMFGGVGVYSQGLFFALMDDDTLYFKVDDSNRADFVDRGMGKFLPFGDSSPGMNYYEVPVEILEDADELRKWVGKSVTVARRKKQGKKQ